MQGGSVQRWTQRHADWADRENALFQPAVNLVCAPIFIPPLCLRAWQVLALSPRPSDKRSRLLFQLHPPTIAGQHEDWVSVPNIIRAWIVAAAHIALLLTDKIKCVSHFGSFWHCTTGVSNSQTVGLMFVSLLFFEQMCYICIENILKLWLSMLIRISK